MEKFSPKSNKASASPQEEIGIVIATNVLKERYTNRTLLNKKETQKINEKPRIIASIGLISKSENH